MPNIKAKNYYGEYVSRENVNKVLYESADEEGVKIPFTYGEAVSKEVELDFSSGNNMEVPIAEGELITDLTVVKPANLAPENIAKDVVIAGIKGEHIGGGDVENMPQLYAPTAISALLTASDGRKYFTVTNPYTKNGMFPRTLQILQSADDGTDIVVAEIALSETSYVSTVSVYASSYKKSLQDHQPKVRFSADGFVPSECLDSSILCNIMALAYILENVNITTRYAAAFTGDVLKFTLVPGSGYYLPKSVEVAGGASYLYDPDGKLLTVTVESGDDIEISIIAVDVPWLRTPVITAFNFPVLKATCPENSEIMALALNELDLAEYESVFSPSAKWSVAAIAGVTYGFAYNTSGYYVSQNKGVNNSFSICRLYFEVSGGSVTVQLACINYAESNYDFGIISTVDKTLLRSSSVDTSNVLKSFKGLGTSSSVQYVSFTVPVGSHFVEIKYRKDGSGNNGNDNFQFKVNSVTASDSNVGFSLDLSEYENLLNYGANNFSLVAKAGGYTDSDPVIETRMVSLVAENDANILKVVGFVPSMVQAFELYIDNELIDTVVYNNTVEWSIDLALYSEEDVPTIHTVHLRAIGNGVVENQSNVIESYLKWYTINWYDDDGTLLKAENVEYNSMPEYNPTKDGYLFLGWDVEPSAVTSNASYTARWIEKIAFSEASWEYINMVSQAGVASKVFAVGNTRTETFNGESITLAVAGFNIDDLADGSGKASISIVCMSVPSMTSVWASSMTSVWGSYLYYASSSTIRSTVENFKSYLPADLVSVIKKVKKACDKSYDSGNLTATYCDCSLWLLSHREMGIYHTGGSYANLGNPYPLFPSVTVTTPYATNLPTVTKTDTTTKVMYWTRQVKHLGTLVPCAAGTDGIESTVQGTNLTSTACYVRFGFCI